MFSYWWNLWSPPPKCLLCWFPSLCPLPLLYSLSTSHARATTMTSFLLSSLEPWRLLPHHAQTTSKMWMQIVYPLWACERSNLVTNRKSYINICKFWCNNITSLTYSQEHYFLKFYSYVHTMFGSFLPPSPRPLSYPPLNPRYPAETILKREYKQ
jgi:hypothetical protein